MGRPVGGRDDVFCKRTLGPRHQNFKDQFELKYVKSDSADSRTWRSARLSKRPGASYATKGKARKTETFMGARLAKLLSKDTDKDNTEKVLKALEKVAAMKIDPRDPNSPAFGELIHQGKLPGGEPKR